MQARIQAAGRPGSALLILIGIFGTAVILRGPIAPAPVAPRPSVIDARDLTVWSASPVTSIGPQIAAPIVRASRRVVDRTPAVARLEVTLFASADLMSQSEVNPRRPALRTEPAVALQPLLSSTAQPQVAGLPAAVVRVPFVEPSSTPQPFSALGTAFVKTGAALTLAFKKTGQGILAPF